MVTRRPSAASDIDWPIAAPSPLRGEHPDVSPPSSGGDAPSWWRSASEMRRPSPGSARRVVVAVAGGSRSRRGRRRHQCDGAACRHADRRPASVVGCAPAHCICVRLSGRRRRTAPGLTLRRCAGAGRSAVRGGRSPIARHRPGGVRPAGGRDRRAPTGTVRAQRRPARSGAPQGSVALVAVGGYGGASSLPHSDIDVLLVHDAPPPASTSWRRRCGTRSGTPASSSATPSARSTTTSRSPTTISTRQRAAQRPPLAGDDELAER